jgi:hypothetical protein
MALMESRIQTQMLVMSMLYRNGIVTALETRTAFPGTLKVIT